MLICMYTLRYSYDMSHFYRNPHMRFLAATQRPSARGERRRDKESDGGSDS